VGECGANAVVDSHEQLCACLVCPEAHPTAVEYAAELMWARYGRQPFLFISSWRVSVPAVNVASMQTTMVVVRDA
jgi:hypothetical protein